MTNRKLSKKVDHIKEYSCILNETDYLLDEYQTLLLSQEFVLQGHRKIKSKQLQEMLDRMDRLFGNDITD